MSPNLLDDLKVTGLQATLRNLETGKEEKIPPLNGYRAEREVLKDGPTQAALREARRGTGSSAGGEPLTAEQTTFEERKKADKRAQVRYPISCYCYRISWPFILLSPESVTRNYWMIRTFFIAVATSCLMESAPP